MGIATDIILLEDLGVSSVILPEFEASLEMARQSLLFLRIPPRKFKERFDRHNH